MCNWDTVDDSVQSHKSRRKKGNWSHRLLLRQIQMNSNDMVRSRLWQRILESSDSVQHVKTLETRKHGSLENTRQGRRQECQVPKLISPASLDHFHLTVSYMAACILKISASQNTCICKTTCKNHRSALHTSPQYR